MITPWILVIVMFSSVPNGGVAITSVPGFVSKEACLVAARAVKELTGWSTNQASVCVNARP